MADFRIGGELSNSSVTVVTRHGTHLMCCCDGRISSALVLCSVVRLSVVLDDVVFCCASGIRKHQNNCTTEGKADQTLNIDLITDNLLMSTV